MKKIFAMLVVVAMLASLCALHVCAVTEEEFLPFGEVEGQYDNDLSKKIKLDGDVSDWQEGGFQKYEIDQYNLDAWLGQVDPNWSIDMWFGADSEYLYIAFKINDADVDAVEDGNQYNNGMGDAFQIQIDFNGWCGDSEAFERAVFYSFNLQEDETVEIAVQHIESDSDATFNYVLSSDDENPEVLGKTKKIENGWCAEFALSWQTLYNHAAEKFSNFGEKIPEFTPGEETKLNLLVCYLNCEDGQIAGAWGTSAALGSLGGGDGWYPEGAGMWLILKGTGDIAVETTEAPTTEEPTEAPTDDDVTDETPTDDGKPEDEATTAPEGGEEQTTEAPKKSGCGSVVALPAVALVAVLGVAFVAKKKD